MVRLSICNAIHLQVTRGTSRVALLPTIRECEGREETCSGTSVRVRKDLLHVDLKILMLLLCLIGILIQPTYAQVTSASITGKVTDPSGAVIPGARVVARDIAKGFTYSTKSNKSGLYTINSLPPSTYDLSITDRGFKTTTRSDITLVVNQHAMINVRMSLGATTQSVTVTGAAPLLDAQDAMTGQTVDRTLINNLPLVGRSVFDLAYLSPGVNPAAGKTFSSQSRANNFTSDGGRGSTAEILLDGVPVTGPNQNTGVEQPIYTPSVDAVQEFKVEQNNFSADKGFSGNTVVNVIMRSGTNHFHGEVYEFLRNKALNANNWFNNRAGLPIPNSRDNDFGFTFGGPIQKNKTFFFGDYEGRRDASAATYAYGIPSLAERQGDFGELCAHYGGTFDTQGKCSTAKGQLWDPYSAVYNAKTRKIDHTAIIPFNNLTTYISPGSPLLAGTPYQPAAVPGNLIDPVAAKMMTYYPTPNVDVGTSAYNPYNNWAGAGTNTSATNQFDVKVDRQINDMTHFDARYSMHFNNSTPSNPWGNPLFPSGSPSLGKVVSTVVHLTHDFSPTFLLSASYGFTRLRSNNLGIPSTFPSFNAISDLGLPPVLGTSGLNVAPEIAVTNYHGGGTDSIGTHQFGILRQGLNIHDLLASANKMRGHQDLQFGGEMRVTQDNFVQYGEPAGKFKFSYTGTSSNALTSGGGDAMASFLTGFADGGSLYDIRPAIATQSIDYALYFQDNWHATNRLTLNLGLRYELPLPRTERYNRQEWLNPTATSPLSGNVTLSSTAAAVFANAGLPVPDLSTIPGGMEFANSNQRYPINANYMGGWQPRFGFAYRLGHSTVVRGGYGVFDTVTNFTASGTGGGSIHGFLQDTPLLTTYQGNGYTPFGRLTNPWPSGVILPPGNSLGLSTDLGIGTQGMIRDWNQIPYMQTWNLGLQHQFGSVLVDAEYVGTKGTHLYSGGATGRNYFGSWIQSATPTQITALNTKVANPFYGFITTSGCGICGPTVTASQLSKPYPQFSGFSSQPPPWANSIYNAFQLRLEKRFSHGLELLGNYTWSKSIDDASVAGSNVKFLGGTTPTAQDPNDLELERSLSEYDVPQVVSFSYVWQLPFGQGKRWGSNWGSIINGFLGGWQTQGFWRFDSGMPLDIGLTGGTSLPTYGPQRPDLTAALTKNNGSEASMVNQYFANPQVAVTPLPFTLGTAPRTIGSVRRPGTKDADLSLFKSFPLRKLGEAGKLQFRVETFNAFNRVQFGAPNTTVGGKTFGEITGQANSPRQVQVAAKIIW